MYLNLNTVLTKVFTIVFVFVKFIVFVFVFKYYTMYLDPSLISTPIFCIVRNTGPILPPLLGLMTGKEAGWQMKCGWVLKN